MEEDLDQAFRECHRRIVAAGLTIKAALEDIIKRKNWSVERLRLEAQLAYLDGRIKQARKCNREADQRQREERAEATAA